MGRLPYLPMQLFIINIFDNILYPALQQSAKVLKRIGRHALTLLHRIVCCTVKPHFLEFIGCDAFFLHSSEQWFVAHHFGHHHQSCSLNKSIDVQKLIEYVQISKYILHRGGQR